MQDRGFVSSYPRPRSDAARMLQGVTEIDWRNLQRPDLLLWALGITGLSRDVLTRIACATVRDLIEWTGPFTDGGVVRALETAERWRPGASVLPAADAARIIVTRTAGDAGNDFAVYAAVCAVQTVYDADPATTAARALAYAAEHEEAVGASRVGGFERSAEILRREVSWADVQRLAGRGV